MSVSDPRSSSDARQWGDRDSDRNPLADLADRLAESRRSGAPAPEELERLVALLAASDYEPGERLTGALEGIARWTESANAPAPRRHEPAHEAAYPQDAVRRRRSSAPQESEFRASRRQPVPRELEDRLADFAQSLTTRQAPAPEPRQPEPRRPQPAGAPPIASLRSALAEIAARQKALDEPEAERAPEHRRPVERAYEPAPRPEPRYEPAPRPEPPQAAPAPAPVLAAPAADIRDLRSEIDRLGRSVGDLPTRKEVDTLVREMSALAGRLGSDRPARLDKDSLSAIDSLVVEVDRMRSDAASPQMITQLSEELHAISARLDVLGPRNSNAIDAIARRVDDVRSELDQFPRATAVDTLASEIQSLISRLDAQERVAGPTRDAVVGLSGRVEALDGKIANMAQAALARDDALARINSTIREELDNLPRAEAVSDLGRQIDALTEGLKSRPTIGPAMKVVENLSDRVQALDGKIDAMAQQGGVDADRLTETVRQQFAAAKSASTDALSKQIEALTKKLSEKRADPSAGLAERIDTLGDRMQAMANATTQRGAAFERIEDSVRVIAEQLLETRNAPKLASVGGAGALEGEVSRIMDGLNRNDGRIDDLHAAFAGLASRIEQSFTELSAVTARAAAPAVARAGDDRLEADISRALDELRASTAQSERRSADTLDAVRSTLERLIDRLEDGFSDRAPAPEPARHAPARVDAEPRFTQAEKRAVPAEPKVDTAEAARAAARRALAEIAAGDEPAQAPRLPRADKPAFEPFSDLAPDHPLEPGAHQPSRSEPTSGGQSAAALIAAARRANTQPEDDLVAVAPFEATPAATSRGAGALGALKARKRPLLLGLVAAFIVFTALYVASGMTGQQEEPAPEPAPQSRLMSPEENRGSAAASQIERRPSAYEVARDIARRDDARKPDTERPVETADAGSSAPAADDLSVVEAPAEAKAADAGKPVDITPPRAPARDLTSFAFSDASTARPDRVEWRAAEPETTGSIAKSGELPDQIGGPTLRMRAVSGDPSAQLEIADRLLEGRNVPADATAASIWLQKAAAQGLAPAQHRLGSLYEKGRGVPRDVVTARRWYEQAAASGNVRAMHNLGVIHAEGGLGKPDFNAAVVWFRMGADRGLVDSQYNLAVLCARGLGGKRDLVEAYKWFALAAAQGDKDAGVKRDEVGKALGGSLGVAKAAVAQFQPRAVDAAANDAPVPPGGWDRVADAAPAAKLQPASRQR